VRPKEDLMDCVTRISLKLDGAVHGCVLSGCGLYRYALWRLWEPARPLWMMALLNPSTATEEEDDATITRCCVRARRGGAGGLVVVNAGAIRETDSDEACAAPDPIGPDNAAWVRALIPTCSLHIAGWGPKAARFGGDALMLDIFKESGVRLMALIRNRDGSPRHPLYIGYDVTPMPWASSTVPSQPLTA
jgi:hypothetical protein